MHQVPCGTSTTLGVQLAELYRLKDDGSVRTMASDECVSVLVVTPNNTRHSINPRLAPDQLSYHAAVTFKEVGLYEIQVREREQTWSVWGSRSEVGEYLPLRTLSACVCVREGVCAVAGWALA